MKRLLSVLLLLSLLITAVGCGADKDLVSSAPPITEPTHELGLFNSSAQTVSYEDTSSEEEVQVDTTVSSETESQDDVVIDNSSSEVSSVASSKESSSKSSTKKDKWANATVRPSDIKNPTGLTSVDRKNNSGKNWQLTLVNPWNTLHTSYQVDVAEIDSRFGAGKLLTRVR